MVRSEGQLRQARREIFNAFPRHPDPRDAMSFQRLLVDEIFKTEFEQQIEKSLYRKAHLHAIHIYGDALAHMLLSRYTIRQLARNTGKPPHLSGQRDAFQLALDCASMVAERGHWPLLADLTNVVKNGDLIICDHPDMPVLIECKLKKVEDPRFAQQGRRGRQSSRLESIATFLRDGCGRIYGEQFERHTTVLQHDARFSYSVINEIVASALQHRPVAMTHSVHEIYAAALWNETLDISSAVENFSLKEGTHLFMGRSIDPLQSGVWEFTPPILWDIDTEAQWFLMEGDVVIWHAVRLESLVGLKNKAVEVVDIVAMPGKVPWGYQVLVNGELLSVSANIMLDVVYNHQTIESAGEMFLEMAEKIGPVMSSLGET